MKSGGWNRVMVGFLGLVFAACDGSCEDAGRTFDEGDQWTCSDGCNYCGCTDGTITSTAMGCPEPAGEAAGKLVCQDDGVHRHGESWDCDEGCSVCSCDDGRVSKLPNPC
jgi:hypothetical protein